MKHVFLLHSAITYLASLSIISEEKLDEKECLFVYQGEDLGFPRIIESISLKEYRLKSFGYVNRVDKIIASFTHNEFFKLYVCSINKFASILMSHKNCVGFNFFEDGTASYLASYSINFFLKEYPNVPQRVRGFKDFYRLFRLYLGNLLNMYPIQFFRYPLDYIPYVNVNDVVFYCTNQYTFPLANNRKIMSVGGEYIKLLPCKYELSNEVVWVSSGMFDFCPQDIPAIASVIKSYFRAIKDTIPNNRIFIKFHQRESEISKLTIRNLFTELGMGIIEIDGATIMEIEILHSKNITMYGDITSLLLYNAMWGGRSISLIKYYANSVSISPSFCSEEILDALKGVEILN